MVSPPPPPPYSHNNPVGHVGPKDSDQSKVTSEFHGQGGDSHALPNHLSTVPQELFGKDPVLAAALLTRRSASSLRAVLPHGGEGNEQPIALITRKLYLRETC